MSSIAPCALTLRSSCHSVVQGHSRLEAFSTLPIQLPLRHRRSRPFYCSAAAGAAATADPFSSTGSSHSHSHSGPSTSADVERTAATLYDLLGIPRTGSQAEIKDAYRHLARRYHPDVRHVVGLTLEESTQRFLEVQEAYEVLSDPQRRAMYDFEMLHGRSRSSGLNHARATWRPRRRAGDGEPLWDSAADEMDVKASWKAQWGRQMDGLRGRRQPKAGSWAAKVRAQQEGEESRGQEA